MKCPGLAILVLASVVFVGCLEGGVPVAGSGVAPDIGTDIGTDITPAGPTPVALSKALGPCMDPGIYERCRDCGDNCPRGCPIPVRWTDFDLWKCLADGAIAVERMVDDGVACMSDRYGLPADCGTCFAQGLQCRWERCSCASATKPACVACFHESGCYRELAACAGFEAVCDDGLDDNGDGRTDCDDVTCLQSCDPEPWRGFP